MGIVVGILMIVLGLLASASWFAARSDQAGELIETLRPLQGWLGAIGAVAGLIFLVLAIASIGGKMTAGSLYGMVFGIGGPVLLAATGFLMGFTMITNMLGSSAEAKEKANELYAALAPYQVALGLATVVVGVLSLFI